MKKLVFCVALAMSMSLAGCSSSSSTSKKVDTEGLTSYKAYEKKMKSVVEDALDSMETSSEDLIDSFDDSYDECSKKQTEIDSWYSDAKESQESVNEQIVELAKGYFKLVIEKEDSDDVNDALYDCYDEASDNLYDLYDGYSDCGYDIYDEVSSLAFDAYYDDAFDYDTCSEISHSAYEQWSNAGFYDNYSSTTSEIYKMKSNLYSAVCKSKDGETIDVDKILEEAISEWKKDQEETEKTTESNTTTTTETEEEDTDDDSEVDEDLVEFLDEYEDFIDEYVDFMAEYKENPTDADLLSEYADMLSEYADFQEEYEEYDTDTMSAADAAYYLEVQTRVLQKLASVQ